MSALPAAALVSASTRVPGTRSPPPGSSPGWPPTDVDDRGRGCERVPLGLGCVSPQGAPGHGKEHRMTDVPTLLVLDADPLPRLGRLTGRVRVLHADGSTLAARLPEADVLLVWDPASRAVRDAWPGEGPRPRWV